MVVSTEEAGFMSVLKPRPHHLRGNWKTSGLVTHRCQPFDIVLRVCHESNNLARFLDSRGE